MPIETRGINHFAVSVSDVEASVRWYRETLGFTLLCRNRIDHIDTPVAHMAAPDGGFVLELYAPPGCAPVPEARKTPDEDMKTNGNKHFSLTIADHEETLRRLAEMDIPVVFEAPCWGTYGIFIHDRDGNLIELFEGDMREKVNAREEA